MNQFSHHQIHSNYCPLKAIVNTIDVSVEHLPDHNAACQDQQRCLSRCWHTCEQVDQGKRCLIACWQSEQS